MISVLKQGMSGEKGLVFSKFMNIVEREVFIF